MGWRCLQSRQHIIPPLVRYVDVREKPAVLTLRSVRPGGLAQIFGRRPVVVGSIAVFTVGSVVSASAQSMNVLIAGRGEFTKDTLSCIEGDYIVLGILPLCG